MSNKFPRVSSINHTYAEYASTNPFQASLDNQEEAVVKYLNNNEGNLSLINEYVSYSIAQKLDVRIPKFGICQFDITAKNNTNLFFAKNNFGPAFYTAFIKKAIPVMSWHSGFIKNQDNFLKTLVLDHIIYNKDRHSGNYLVSPSGILFAIDHSHVFKNQCIWNKYTFIQGMNNNDFLDKNILEENKDTYDYFFNSLVITKNDFNIIRARVKQELTPVFIKKVLKEIPAIWKEGIPDEDIAALEKYINYRIEHIDDIIDLICKERGIV